MKVKLGLFALGTIIAAVNTVQASNAVRVATPAKVEAAEQINLLENVLNSNGHATSEEIALGAFEAQAYAEARALEAAASQDQLLQVQQRDVDCRLSQGAPGCAEEISATTNKDEYLRAAQDPYYGYQIFILVDKSVANPATRLSARNGSVRHAQTMYVYKRQGQQIVLVSTQPVSTGRETSPNSKDTREGYMRVQSAQKDYRSVTYGEAMPYSLWFESEYGTAIHQTRPDWCANQIGMRASAGCIRLCSNAAPALFELVNQYPSVVDRYRSERRIGTNAVVLLHKRNGAPIARGETDDSGLLRVRTTSIQNGVVTEAPKVIRGFPAFVRVVNVNTPEKVMEVENVLKNPTEGFKQYFKPVSRQAIENAILGQGI